MNRKEMDLLKILTIETYTSQRMLSEMTGYSLGVINQTLKNLIEKGYLDKNKRVTLEARQLFEKKAPRNAIILAAGFGMRMVPINREIPKALLEVKGEVLIERIINQLHGVNIREIYVVVGFMKEKFEYLIDEFDVKLIVNKNYVLKNNLYSLFLAKDYISNTYIIPSDIWCKENPFNREELYSWYMVSDLVDTESLVRFNRKMELVKVKKEGNQMIGIAYLTGEQSEKVKKKLEIYSEEKKYDNCFWEETLYFKDKMIVQAKVVHSSENIEVNTYEQLRELDEQCRQLESKPIKVIASALKTEISNITNISLLKKGMTNRSFLFSCINKRYIMRIPGEGTEQLINRVEESNVYKTLKGKDICDEIIYINTDDGYKITEFYEEARVCDSKNIEDVKKCMVRLKEFHEQNLYVDHEFDIFKEINFYESLWNEKESVYKDYVKVKKNIFSLKSYIERNIDRKCLTHIDAVPDNFLFIKKDDIEEIRLIDWEYAGMQDPHVDIAMFCIYSLYNKREVDQVIDIYFEGKCEDPTRIKIYCYIAVCGLLWSNWCEYKRGLGIEFGEYSICQYRYAKEYYRIAMDEMIKRGEK